MRLSQICLAITQLLRGGGAWSPSALYAASQVGAWYDPSDLSTMFTDAAGTTPVVQPGTVADQPVGLITDKSPLGIDASQSTSTARPLLSARVNSATYTSQLETVFTGSEATLTGNAALAPDGTMTATKVTETTANGGHGAVRFDLGLGVVGDATRSIYMKAAGRRYLYMGDSYKANMYMYLDLVTGVFRNTSGGLGYYATDAGDGWWRICLPYNATNTYTNFAFVFNRTDTFVAGTADTYAGDGTSGIYIWGDQCEHGLVATTYQRVTTASDYDGTPGKFPYYLKFDGVDDYLSTAAIDFTGTDQMTVFLGLNASSDGVRMPYTAPNTYPPTAGFCCYGESLSPAHRLHLSMDGDVYYDDSASQTDTRVLTHSYDRSQTVLLNQYATRENGVARSLTANAAAISTGNFGNISLFFGAPAYPFNGNLYSLIIAGALYDAATIGEAETWVAAKTGVTL